MKNLCIKYKNGCGQFWIEVYKIDGDKYYTWEVVGPNGFECDCSGEKAKTIKEGIKKAEKVLKKSLKLVKI